MRKLRIARGKLLEMLLIVIYFCFFAAETTNAAQWLKTYAGSFNSIQQTSDGGFIAAGSISSEGAGGEDFWVVKLNADGSIAWQKAYGGAGDEKASSIVQTPDGDYIVVGSTNSFGAGGYDVWILKLNSHGSVVWQKTYGGNGNDYGHSIKQNLDGGFIVAGCLGSFSLGIYSSEAWIFRLTSQGDIFWQKTYGQGEVMSVSKTLDGGYIAAVGSRILRLSFEGNVVWQKAWPDFTAFRHIQATQDWGYIATGAYDGVWSLVTRLGDDGAVIWQKSSWASEWFFSAELTSDGGYILAGADPSSIELPDRGSIMKLSADGSPVWGMVLKDLNGLFNFAQQTSDGDYIATTNRGVIVRLDKDGNIPGCSAIARFEGEIRDISLDVTAAVLSGTDTHVVPQATTAALAETCVTETTLCFSPDAWTAPVGFPINITFVSEDASGHRDFNKVTQVLSGKLGLYFNESNLVPGERGCYVSFVSDDGGTTMCFRETAAISTDASQNKADRLLLIGTGDLSMVQEGTAFSGLAFLDTKGFLKNDSSGEITSITLDGRISGGVDGRFIFSGRVRATLTR